MATSRSARSGPKAIVPVPIARASNALNDRLAKFYEKEPVGPDFKKVVLPGSQRAGVLTHPYLLTSFSYFKDTSPIHRGVFLTRSIVGRALKPPPEAVE